MKIKRWWEKQELIAMIPTFEEYAEKYLAALPPRPKPVSQVAALKAEVEALKAQLATPAEAKREPVAPVE